ncbi:transcriptional regulator [Geobacter sp. AOG2]|nr:transcriptional regulator [Geobacter sp. AOG2]
MGSAIRARRKKRGLSQEKLAELAELHPTYISEIERGCVNASIYSIFLIANVLEMELADLMNLSAASINRQLENELAEISGTIRGLDESKQKIVLNGLKGMLSGL